MPTEAEHIADLRAEVIRLHGLLEDARSWARHGYEIGQRSNLWSDHGVAPKWLTTGWPSHFDADPVTKVVAQLDTLLTESRTALRALLGAATTPPTEGREIDQPSYDRWHGETVDPDAFGVAGHTYLDASPERRARFEAWLAAGEPDLREAAVADELTAHDQTVGIYVDVEQRHHCGCGRALPCRHCPEETP